MKSSLVTSEMRKIRWRYRIIVIGAMAIYVLLVSIISGWLGWEPPKSGFGLYLAALSPALPIAAVVYAMGRYLIDEPDEFFRMVQIQTALLATGLTMFTCTAWGFLALYVHIWENHVISLVFPMWWFFFGVSAPIVNWRYR
jgi:hypothetical protein